jgi:hypothetical protein
VINHSHNIYSTVGITVGITVVLCMPLITIRMQGVGAVDDWLQIHIIQVSSLLESLVNKLLLWSLLGQSALDDEVRTAWAG